MTIAEWADRFRYLSSEASAEPGRWSTARAEYQRGIMDAISDPKVSRVAVMTSSQIGKTEIILNVVGYYVSQDPSPILVLQPTLDMAEAWSKDRLAPMLRDTPIMHGIIADPRARDSGNTIVHKRFHGGHLSAVGANSAASLSSRPIRIVLADEVDRYPVSAGTEGDPLGLAIKRTNNFWNRKIVTVSTPTVKGLSRIEREWNDSDQRYFYVPCPHCRHHQRLVWAQVRWPEGEPLHATYVCEDCNHPWNDGQRHAAVRQGFWQAERDYTGRLGFRLNELYSPWVKLGEVARNFLEAKGDPQSLRVFVNTSLGDTWEERGHTVDAEGVEQNRENYGPESLPDEIFFLTAGVDTQDDRIEVEIVGWGDRDESWGVEYRVIYGDPVNPETWKQLDELLMQVWRTETGRPLRVIATAIDTGGHRTASVHGYCRPRLKRRVYPIKGIGGQHRPVWPLRSSTTKTNDRVFIVGVDSAKDQIYAYLQVAEPGPGYVHLPVDPETSGYDRAWIHQLTSEQRKTRYRHGQPYSIWELPKGRRNEALDCRVYAYAALKSLPRASQRAATQKSFGRDQRPTPEEPPMRLETTEPAATTQQKPHRKRPVRRSRWMG